MMLLRLFTSNLPIFSQMPSVYQEFQKSKCAVLRFDGLNRETQLDETLLENISYLLNQGLPISRLCLEYQNTLSHNAWKNFLKMMGRSKWSICDLSLQGCFFSGAIKDNFFQMLLTYKKPLWIIVSEEVKIYLLEKSKKASYEDQVALARHTIITLAQRPLSYRQFEAEAYTALISHRFYMESLLFFQNMEEEKEEERSITLLKQAKITFCPRERKHIERNISFFMKSLNRNKIHTIDFRGTPFSETSLKILIEGLWLYHHCSLWMILDQCYEKRLEELILEKAQTVGENMAFMRHMIFYENNTQGAYQEKCFYIKGNFFSLQPIKSQEKVARTDCCCGWFS